MAAVGLGVAAADLELNRKFLFAALGGYTQCVVTSLDNGANIDWTDAANLNFTALMWAALRGHIECVRLLIAKGATVDAVQLPERRTALMLASSVGHLAIVELLVAAGADVHHQGASGANALHLAARRDRHDVCLFLLSKGADLMAKTNKNWTALTHYGIAADTRLTSATLAICRSTMEQGWRDGPHPTQKARRENWQRRQAILQVTAENGYRPLSHRLAAMPPVDPAAIIPAIPLDTPEQLHAHLLSQVLSNEGIHRNIVKML